MSQEETGGQTAQREGVVVRPHCRLTEEQIRTVDAASRALLEDPGIMCYNQAAAEVYEQAGAKLEDAGDCVRVRLPESVVDKALQTAPSKVILGAREAANRLVLDAAEPRVRFGSGSETNVWLDVEIKDGVPHFTRLPGSIGRLRRSAHLCDNLEHLDFFIRNVNIQDDGITAENKDVNQFFTSLNNITKHVQAGLTSLEAIDDVVRLGQIVAGGPEAFEKEPTISFITCVIKSPLQMVDDTAAKLIAIAERRVPVVISSCPMGGATGPFDEFGMVAQVNAEVIAGVVLTQLVSPGAPVLYGAVPVRTRLDNLNDMYAAAEFVHYNVDCAQMARHYQLPCYSTSGVADTSVPGIQASVEKMLTLATVPQSGPQYVHYAFGLLERTNVFCPEQAVMDDAHIGLIKQMLRDTTVQPQRQDEVVSLVRDVMATSHKTYMYHIPLPSRDEVYVRYPLEDASEGGALAAAQRQMQEIIARPHRQLPDELRNDIIKHVPGLLPVTTNAETETEAIR